MTSRFPPFHGSVAETLIVFIGTCLSFGCGSNKSPSMGNADLTVRFLTSTTIASLKVTVQSPTVLPMPMTIPLLVKRGESSALIKNLPIADDYIFTSVAFDRDNIAVTHGAVSAVSILKNHTTKVIIYLNEIIEPPPYTNASPLIDGITLSTAAITPGSQVDLRAIAHDPDTGQTATIDFTWSVSTSCGTMSVTSTILGSDSEHPSESKTKWIAPLSEGTCPMTLTVKDVLGLSSSVTFILHIGLESHWTGTANVSAVFNEAPAIMAMTASPAQLSNQGTTTGILDVLVTDPENDNLSYAWSTDPVSSCIVEFTNPAVQATAFTVSGTQPFATFCAFIVTVSDGSWPDTTVTRNTSIAVLTLAMADPVIALTPPVFGIAYQSDDAATNGLLVNFGAIAFDPEGGTLAFDWSASVGSVPIVTEPTTLGLDSAFTTAATWMVPDCAENLTTDFQIHVTATSSMTNLASTLILSLASASRP
jgi:hypothetical protein